MVMNDHAWGIYTKVPPQVIAKLKTLSQGDLEDLARKLGRGVTVAHLLMWIEDGKLPSEFVGDVTRAVGLAPKLSLQEQLDAVMRRSAEGSNAPRTPGPTTPDLR